MTLHDPADQDNERPTRALAIQSAFWAAVGGLVRYALAGITTLALTRLLEPHDFGLVAITFAAQELIAHVAPVGIHDALIQRPRPDKADLDTAFWSVLALSGGFALLVIALAPLVAAWFGHPILAPLLIGMSLASMLRAFSTVPRAMLSRRMDFRTPAVVRAVGMIIGGVCAVVVAALGGGAWSLIVQIVVVNLTGTILTWRVVNWRPGWRLSRPALHQLWSFAPSVSMFTVLAYVISNADDQMVGYRLGTEALGYYALAYSFMAWPVRDVLGGVAVVLYPIFSRFQDDLPRLQATYLESLQLATVFAFPTLALLAITAPVLVPFLLGARWKPSILTTQILAISGLRESTMMLNGQIYRALGKPQLHTLLGLCNVGCYLTAFVVGLDFGIEGVAFFYALTGVILHPVSCWLVLGAAHLSLWHWLRALGLTAAATALMSVAAVLVLHCARLSWSLGDGASLAITGVVAALVYALTLGVFTPLGLERVLAEGLRILRAERFW